MRRTVLEGTKKDAQKENEQNSIFKRIGKLIKYDTTLSSLVILRYTGPIYGPPVCSIYLSTFLEISRYKTCIKDKCAASGTFWNQTLCIFHCEFKKWSQTGLLYSFLVKQYFLVPTSFLWKQEGEDQIRQNGIISFFTCKT